MEKMVKREQKVNVVIKVIEDLRVRIIKKHTIIIKNIIWSQLQSKFIINNLFIICLLLLCLGDSPTGIIGPQGVMGPPGDRGSDGRPGVPGIPGN